jgi:hypothetical protein
MIGVRAFAGLLLIALLALLGFSLEMAGHGFIHLGIGCTIAGKRLAESCFYVGQFLMKSADQVVGVELYEDWDD